eukprot:177351_1
MTSLAAVAIAPRNASETGHTGLPIEEVVDREAAIFGQLIMTLQEIDQLITTLQEIGSGGMNHGLPDESEIDRMCLRGDPETDRKVVADIPLDTVTDLLAVNVRPLKETMTEFRE